MDANRIEDKNYAHCGDPCRFCGQRHDDVAPGPCQNIIAFRSPLSGEWFIGYSGQIDRARFDFTEQKFSILGRYPPAISQRKLLHDTIRAGFRNQSTPPTADPEEDDNPMCHDGEAEFYKNPPPPHLSILSGPPAAPDLLEACRGLLDMITDNRTHGPEIDNACTALAKAKGE